MKVSKLISTITIASALCLSLSNALVFSPCDKIQSLVKEYFEETIVDEMMCIAYNEAINPKSDAIGLWNLKKEYCNTVCKSICNSEIDLADIKLNTQCAEMVYLEFGFNGWDSYNNGLCKDSWGFCNTQIQSKQHGSHSSSTSRDSSSSRDSTGTGYSSSGSGTSGTSGSNSGQTGHFVPGQSGHVYEIDRVDIRAIQSLQTTNDKDVLVVYTLNMLVHIHLVMLISMNQSNWKRTSTDLPYYLSFIPNFNSFFLNTGNENTCINLVVVEKF
ncbi:hypothetical protein ACTFIU_004034 [Dictyostelium citrinum]